MLPKFGFVTLDITRKNSLYWILNVEIYLDAMDIGIPLNKEIKHLSNMTKILWKKISQILWIYLMTMYGWLDKAIKLLMKKKNELLPILSFSILYCFFSSLLSIISSLLYYLLFSLLFVLFHNTLSARDPPNLLHSQKWMQQ